MKMMPFSKHTGQIYLNSYLKSYTLSHSKISNLFAQILHQMYNLEIS